MKKIGMGYENYKEFVDEKLYYVDKTLLIRDILEKGGKVTLFTRPRRFGKTLALSTIRTFFELEYDRDGKPIDKRRYFEGMKIMDAGSEVLSKMGSYPVIKMTLKSAKQPNFNGAFMKLQDEVIEEFKRHDYLLKSDILSDKERAWYEEILGGFSIWMNDRILDEKWPEIFKQALNKFSTALRGLSALLRRYHGKNVIILIDEYDVPLENAYFTGFYPEMVGFIRSLFESSLKTNNDLEFAVLVGCLRISKESIFTGLNNLTIVSVLSEQFTEGFGFTQEETEKMLSDYGLSEKVDEVRDWYNGYLFGKTDIYNPWSVIHYIYDHVPNPKCFPKPYWANTSSNSIIKDLIARADEKTREELDNLINGGTVEKRIHEDITYDDIAHDDAKKSDDNLWNFLFFTGYMRKVSERQEEDKIYLTMKIPNREIRSIYGDQITEWFERKVRVADRTDLFAALLKRDTAAMGKILTGLLKGTISTFDSSESFYHGYLASMLTGMEDYAVRTNREAGNGRPDIIMYPETPTDPAYIFELKVRKKFNEMQDGLEEAFEQIRDRRYEDGILEEGYVGAVSFGVCFCKKSCIVGLCPA